jgi:Ca2+-binding RTX toxin-like protein
MPFAPVINLGTLNGVDGFRLNGVGLGDRSGASVASAGDVNGDGFDDLIVGAQGANNSSGSSYVVFGKAGGFTSTIELSSLNGTTGFRLRGVAMDDQSGFSAASAGDVNGDGFDDLIVGAVSADPGGNTSAGSSYVVFGKAGGFASSLALSSLNGTTGFRLDGVAEYDQSGTVASAGDVNGDGFDDLIVGAGGAGPGGRAGAGSSYVVFGKAGGFASTLALSALNGTNGFRLDGVTAWDLSGYSVASAGDVNGDGFDDLIVGARQADPGGNNAAGSSYVVFGKAGGFTSTIALSSLNGTTGFRLDGAAANDSSGWSVASAGDVNGDGFDDLIVGAISADPGGRAGAGSSYVVFGKAGGFASTLALSSLNGTTGFRLDGVAGMDGSGYSVASAGDFNGDGFDDLIVGAAGADPGGNASAGSSYVVFGKAGGFASTLALSSLNGTNGFRLDGVALGDQSGSSVASAGDVNGDGFDDLIVGANQADPDDNDAAGSSYVVFGRATAQNENPFTNGNDVINLNTLLASGTYYLPDVSNALDGNDTVTLSNTVNVGVAFNGGIGNDTITGGTGNDVIDGGAGADSINGGAGTADIVSFSSLGLGIYVDLVNGFAQDEGGLYDRLTGIEGAYGTDALRSGLLSDVLLGDGNANIFFGFGGQDYIIGNGGADTIDVGSGANNIALGGTGNDTIIGGADVDFLYGNDGSDSLTGGGGNDWLFGGDFAGAAITGADRAFGGAGNDVIAVGDRGGSFALADGGSGNDMIYGGALANDVIRGGTGSDYAYGNTGADTYRFETGDLVSGDVDTIFAFNAGDRFSFAASYLNQISVAAGTNAGNSGVYLAHTGSTWIAWLPFQSVANVNAGLIFE